MIRLKASDIMAPSSPPHPGRENELKDASYDATVFNSILSLDGAHASVTSNSRFEAYLSEFATMAVSLAQNDVFGLTLVHRHTRIDPGTRMLDFKQTLQPFPLPDCAQDLHGCPIRPKSYALVDGAWMPYEYELGIPGPLLNSETHFFDCVKRRLEDLGLENIGLRRYSPTDTEELEVMESGGISVKIPMDLVCRQCNRSRNLFKLRVYTGSRERQACSQNDLLGVSVRRAKDLQVCLPRHWVIL